MDPVPGSTDPWGDRTRPYDPSGPLPGQEDDWNALWALYGTSVWTGLFWTLVSLIAPKIVLRRLK